MTAVDRSPAGPVGTEPDGPTVTAAGAAVTTGPGPGPVSVSGPFTITEAAAALRAGTVTSVGLVRQCLALADELDDRLGVFITRFDDAAMAAAEAADAELAAGIDRGPLHGIPLGIKDIIAATGGPTTAQSLVLDPAWGQAQGDAVVVQRLRDAGAIMVGKAATLEFAIGIADPAKPFPIHRNPWDTARWPGGSSSGTGAGVAAGLFLGGLGTDTGGSIRIPAAYCGITGHKPTYGLVPKSGCAPLGYSLDHIGPMARSAADCAALLAVLAGHHPSDPTAVVGADPGFGAGAGPGGAPAGAPVGAVGGDLTGLRIGVDRANHLDAPNVVPEAVAAFEAAVAQLETLGATVVDVSLPHYAEAATADLVIMVCEAASYHMADFRSRWTDYGAPTRKVLAWSAAYSGADYVQAQRLRRLVVAETAALLADLDAMIHPTNLGPAPLLADTDIDNWFEWPLFTGFANTVGLPTASLPMGFAAGMPLGLSVMGRPFTDGTVLGIGQAFQSATGHHLALPPVLAPATT